MQSQVIRYDISVLYTYVTLDDNIIYTYIQFQNRTIIPM